MLAALIHIAFVAIILAITPYVLLPMYAYDFAAESWVVYSYSLQFLVCYIFTQLYNANYTFFAALFYLIVGLIGLPVFSFGGGWRYLMEPSFGYILGLVFLALFGFFWKYVSTKERSFGLIPNASVFALIAAHLIGLVYLLLTQRLDISNFINMSLYQFIYDLIFVWIIVTILPHEHYIDEDRGYEEQFSSSDFQD